MGHSVYIVTLLVLKQYQVIVRLEELLGYQDNKCTGLLHLWYIRPKGGDFGVIENKLYGMTSNTLYMKLRGTYQQKLLFVDLTVNYLFYLIW